MNIDEPSTEDYLGLHEEYLNMDSTLQRAKLYAELIGVPVDDDGMNLMSIQAVVDKNPSMKEVDGINWYNTDFETPRYDERAPAFDLLGWIPKPRRLSRLELELEEFQDLKATDDLENLPPQKYRVMNGQVRQINSIKRIIFCVKHP